MSAQRAGILSLYLVELLQSAMYLNCYMNYFISMFYMYAIWLHLGRHMVVFPQKLGKNSFGRAYCESPLGAACPHRVATCVSAPNSVPPAQLMDLLLRALIEMLLA